MQGVTQFSVHVSIKRSKELKVEGEKYIMQSVSLLHNWSVKTWDSCYSPTLLWAGLMRVQLLNNQESTGISFGVICSFIWTRRNGFLMLRGILCIALEYLLWKLDRASIKYETSIKHETDFFPLLLNSTPPPPMHHSGFRWRVESCPLHQHFRRFVFMLLQTVSLCIAQEINHSVERAENMLLLQRKKSMARM